MKEAGVCRLGVCECSWEADLGPDLEGHGGAERRKTMAPAGTVASGSGRVFLPAGVTWS